MLLSQIAFWFLYFGIGAVLGALMVWKLNRPKCPSRGEFFVGLLVGGAFWIPASVMLCIFGPLGWFADNITPKISAWMAKPLCNKQS